MAPEKITRCRNCNSDNTAISKKGVITPFFGKRVFNIEFTTNTKDKILYSNKKNNFIKSKILKVLKKYIFKNETNKVILNIYKSNPITSIIVCNDCNFIGPEKNYSYDLLSGLYHDYRSETYNKDRCEVEPSYDAIQHLVGKDKNEIKERLKNVDSIIKKYSDTKNIKNILDWGGGEGKFIPTKFVDKNVSVYDVSNEPLINENYKRVDKLDDTFLYDYIQVCHVLEHVSEPNSTVKEILKNLRAGGLLYIEVPQDRTDIEIENFKYSNSDINHYIHEHINLYSVKSVEGLGESLGLEIIYIGMSEMDLGWSKGKIISGLFKNK